MRLNKTHSKLHIDNHLSGSHFVIVIITTWRDYVCVELGQ
jgi:hypothetical protein